MKKILLSVLFVCLPCSAADEPISLVLERADSGKEVKKMPVFMGVLSKGAVELSPLIDQLKSDLERSGELSVVTEFHPYPTSKAEIKVLADRGFTYGFFIGRAEDGAGVEWRLYDIVQSAMSKGKKFETNGLKLSDVARHIAGEVWRELMGNAGPFQTRLCYVKKMGNRHKTQSQLVICNHDGSGERIIVDAQKIHVAPYWSRDVDRPSIFYSEFTPRNVRLMAVDVLSKKKRPVLDFDGTIVGVSFPETNLHGGDVVYGRSGGIWRYHYDSELKKGMHTLVINEGAVAASPTVLANGDIIYCCRGAVRRYYDATKKRETISNGYCVGPAVHEKSGKVVYSRKEKGVLQLYVLDLKSGNEEQITVDKGDKTDPCWSPCGSWIAFCTMNRGKYQVETIHAHTKKRYVISKSNQDCRCPSWSSVFKTVI